MVLPLSYVRSLLVVLLVMSTSCEKDFYIETKTNKPQLIVEGYINNELPLYNYVILSRSQDYYSPDVRSLPVSGAAVWITEGERLADNSYQWDPASRTSMKETVIPSLSPTPLPGFYFDPRLAIDPSTALKGVPGKYYLLEIETAEKRYTSITAMPPIVPLDSLSVGFHFVDDFEGLPETKARITIHYKDPDTIGNTQMHYWRHRDTRANFGWGGMGTNRFTPGTDELVNGQYIHLTHSSGFHIPDTVQYFMASVDRSVYNFWDSFNKARSNDGPFATPVTLRSTIEGNDVIGCFSGLSLSTKTIITK